MAWTDDRVKKLKQLWNKGLSASQIAEELGDVTRNAVIGKAHRLGLSSRPSPVKQSPAKKAAPKKTATKAKSGASKSSGKAATKTAAPKKPAPAEAKAESTSEAKKTAAKPKKAAAKKADDAERVTILTLTERMCKWPIGHPGEPDFHFCGARSEPSQPYCATHAEMAFQAPQPRKDRRRNR